LIASASVDGRLVVAVSRLWGGVSYLVTLIALAQFDTASAGSQFWHLRLEPVLHGCYGAPFYNRNSSAVGSNLESYIRPVDRNSLLNVEAIAAGAIFQPFAGFTITSTARCVASLAARSGFHGGGILDQAQRLIQGP